MYLYIYIFMTCIYVNILNPLDKEISAQDSNFDADFKSSFNERYIDAILFSSFFVNIILPFFFFFFFALNISGIGPTDGMATFYLLNIMRHNYLSTLN